MPSKRVQNIRARQKLRRILQATSNDKVKRVMSENADMLHEEMLSRAPEDTGGLKNDIKKFVSKNGLRAEVGFRGKKNKHKHIARFIEFGTKGHVIKTSLKKVLSNGSIVFGREIEVPAMPARPFIQPAWDFTKDKMRKNMDDLIKDAIKKAQQL